MTDGNGPIIGDVEFCRSDGHWHISLHAPEWVISDIKRDLAAKGNVVTVGNFGGRSMLLVAASWDARHPTKADTDVVSKTRE